MMRYAAMQAIRNDPAYRNGEYKTQPPSVHTANTMTFVMGSSPLVLQGAASLLKSARPALFVELHEEGLKRFGTSVAAILAHLSGLGYEAYWLMRSGSSWETPA